VAAGASIDASGKGYVGGNRDGNTSALGQTADHNQPSVAGRGGGSHGALGGFQGSGSGLGSTVNPVFDDLTDPRRPGGGGSGRLGTTELGYNGGGLVRIEAAALVLQGRIIAEGDGKQRAGQLELGGAGAGGGIAIGVGTLSGAGEISADGGFADGGVGAGAGGGGRIAIRYTDRAGWTGSVHALGGALIPNVVKATSVGGAGTVFWKGATQGYGDLIVDNQNRAQSFTRTQVRAVGTGTLASLTATQAGTSAATLPISDTRLAGLWLVLKGRTSTPFRIAGNTASSIAIDPATGDMTAVAAAGDGYQGALVLDNLTVANRAAMTTGGELVIIATGAATITGGGTLVAPPVVHW